MGSLVKGAEGGTHWDFWKKRKEDAGCPVGGLVAAMKANT